MKRPFFIILIGVMGIVIIWYFRPKPPAVSSPVAMSQATSTNVTATANSANSQPPQVITPSALPAIASSEPKKILFVNKAQNIADWTNAIPSLKLLTHSLYNDSWIVEQKDPSKCPALLLTGVNGSNVQYSAELLDVEAVGEHIRSVEMHTLNMNIGETQELGLQLCDLLGHDPKDFLAWCDKVGNNWVDAPLYDGFSLPVPNSNKFSGFGVHRTFNNEKPWYILFFITDP